MVIALCLFTEYLQVFSLVFSVQQYCIAEDSKKMHPPFSHFYLRLNKPISFSFCLYIMCSVLEGFLWACSGIHVCLLLGCPNWIWYPKYDFMGCRIDNSCSYGFAGYTVVSMGRILLTVFATIGGFLVTPCLRGFCNRACVKV